MAIKLLVLGASYGSLLATKAAMAGHDATLICRSRTAGLINSDGTEVRLKLRGEDTHRAIRSGNLPGRIDAATPETVDPTAYDLVVLAMQEPQYTDHTLRTLLIRIADAGLPCLSLMNMPPLPYLARLGLDTTAAFETAYTDARVWDRFDPATITLCSPDPQAFRPPEEGANVLHVGLPTNFKAAAFGSDAHTAILRQLADDIDSVRLDGLDVPVKLKVSDDLFVPLAKWSMLLTGNYRCVLADGIQPIRDAVHSDLDRSAAIYAHVDAIAQRLGASPEAQVPFEKYARAAESLLKPSSVARAVAAGAPYIERVDRLVQAVGRAVGLPSDEIDQTVAIVDRAVAANHSVAA